MRLGDGLGHRLFAVDVLAGRGGVDRHLGVPVVGRGDADDIDFVQIEELAIVLDDVLLVVGVEADLLGGRIETLQVFRLLSQTLGNSWSYSSSWPIPHIGHAFTGDLLAFVDDLLDDVQVSLAASAETEEGDADALIGIFDARVTCRGETQLLPRWQR